MLILSMKTLNYILLLSILLISCTSTTKSNDSDKVEPDTIVLNVTDSSITSSFDVKPDSSVNIKAVKEHFEKYPDRWNAAFKYLAELDTTNLKKGRINLSEDVYVSYNEYTTKNSEQAFYESHKQYIDIQYVISGEEHIALTHNIDIPVKKEYNPNKDITFYDFDGGNLLLATPERYFIFFPEDLHKPSLKTSENSIVKKIVVKIKFN